MSDTSHEPSIEDVLTSIKKIIAEDSARSGDPSGGTLHQPISVATGDVLELTEEVPSHAAQQAQPEPTINVHFSSTTPSFVRPAVTEVAAEHAPGLLPTVEQAATEEALLSPEPASASRDALERLVQAQKSNVEQKTSAEALEALVSEMIRPLLKEWLDGNLPHIVERMVAEEIARLRP